MIEAGTDYNLIKTSFASGEVSPRLVGRLDFAKYFTGLDTCVNWLIQPQGGIARRPGTRYVATVKTPANAEGTCLMPFQFNLQQNYIIERGDKYFRFYRNGGQIQSGGNAVEVTTPYAFADIHQVKWTQSADTLYSAHQNYAPRKLTRTTDTAWTLTRINYLGGPWLDENTVTTALVASNNTTNPATTTITGAANNGAGLIRITSGGHGYSTNDWLNVQQILGTTEANGYWKITVIDANTYDLVGSTFANAYVSGGKAYKLSTLTASGTNADGSAFAPFKTTGGSYGDATGHKLALWRVKASAAYGYVKIANVTSTTVCNVDIIDTLDGTGTTSKWQEGAWSDVQGYPGCCAIKDQRLLWANSPSQPQNIWASRVNDYEDYRPQFVAGTTADTDAWAYRLGTQRVNPIMWMADSALGLLVGTIGEEHLGTGSSGTGPITPNSVFFRVQTSYGSIGHFIPVRIGSITLFITRTGRKVRGAQYDIYKQTHVAQDYTLLSEHIAGSGSTAGFEHIYYATEPDSQVWLSRNDGQAACMTFVPEQEVYGWARILTEDGITAQIESIAVIPSTDGLSDTVWMVVKRVVNGSTTRYIEYLDPAVNTDCAITVDNTQTTQTLTLGQTGVGTGVSATTDVATNPVWTVGQEIVTLPALDGSVPATQSGGSGRATITHVTDSQHCTVSIFNSFASTTITAGQWGLGSYSFSGASQLAGKVIQMIGVGFGGALYPSVTVSAGGVATVPTGQPSIVSVEIGLPFTATAVTLRPDPQKGEATIQADKKRWAKIKVRGTQLKGVTIAGFTDAETVDTANEIAERDFTMAAGVTVPNYTGDIILTDATDYSFSGKIQITQPNPVPTVIYAIFGRLETGAI